MISVPRLSNSVQVSPGTTGTAIASCLSGEITTGGGFIVSHPNVDVYKNRFVTSFGWVVDVQNNEPFAIQFSAVAQCTRLTP